MGNENILVGYFFECLSCKASFIRMVDRDFAVTHEGRIYLKDPGQNIGIDRTRAGADERIFVDVVRCPCCLSGDVRSAEIGDKK